MADPIGYYKTHYGRNFTPGQGLPLISTELDSVRAYQFEIHFRGLPSTVQGQSITDLTLAAKKVTGLELGVEPMPVDRVNDKVFYPGRPTPGDMVVTFDNLYLRQTASDLWKYFASIYDPISGEVTQQSPPGGTELTTFKADMCEILQLDNTMTPRAAVELYGVWPSKWSAAEFNYSTNDFHSIDVTFKYDFMQQKNILP